MEMLEDPRLDRLARVLVEYSLGVGPGDLVRIAGPALAAPLVRAAYRAVLRVGGHPFTRIEVDGLDELLLRAGSGEQLDFLSPLEREEVERIDCSLGVWGEYNTRALTGVDPARQARARQARRPLQERFLERAGRGELRWCGVQYPTQADAQEAEMSLAEYADFVLRACLVDRDDPVAEWGRIAQEQEALVEWLNQVREVRLTAPGTDLTLGVAGRRWINCCGHENMPDGEVFTGPLEEATRGRVRFSFPSIHDGREVEGVELVFRDGRVEEAHAAKGEKFLHALLELDEGSRRLGEFSFGNNYAITRHTRNTLFDEKIGGTVHLALGAAYPETGGENRSALHWDLVVDLRREGRVYADGRLVYEKGRFLAEG
ncbi:MAG: aminopeptidase [Thermaerobacter sp.]|nr:aminopeptidase [Thermaerobacter sp.]